MAFLVNKTQHSVKNLKDRNVSWNIRFKGKHLSPLTFFLRRIFREMCTAMNSQTIGILRFLVS